MSDYEKVLEKAREEMVKARRNIADGLAKLYDGRTTPDLRSNFIDVQTTIELIDKAIADEQKLALTGADENFGRKIEYKDPGIA